MSALHTDRTQIGKLRMQGGPRPDSIALLLGQADMRPACMPPASVLIVRSLADPLPGRLAGQRPDPEWERAVRDRLAEVFRRAARPASQAVPMDAEAVVFADEAEFLASLAHDLVRHRLRERWWWRGVIGLGRLVPGPTLASVFLDHAASVPAALSLLADRGCAAEVVRGLTPPEARSVLCAVCSAYGVGHVATVADHQSGETGSAAQREAPDGDEREESLAETAAPLSPAPPRPGKMKTGSGRAEGVRGGTGRDRQPPWAAYLAPQAVPAALERSQACLLGVALALHARPGAVRAPGFAASLRRWRHAADAPIRQDKPVSAGPIHHPPRLDRDAPREAAAPAPSCAAPHDPANNAQSLAPLHATAASAPAPPAQAARSEQPTETMPPLSPWHAVAKATGTPVPPASSLDRPGEPGRSHFFQSPSPELAPGGARQNAEPPALRPWEAVPPSAPTPAAATRAGPEPAQAEMPPISTFPEGGAETALSGVLFLINLMIALDLPACFEETWQLESALGAWGVLEALGRALVPPEAAHPGDPLWCALKNLGGCGVDELGGALPDRVDYAMPALWHEHRPEPSDRPRYWSAGSGKIRVWTAAGYISNEIFVASDTGEAAADALAQHCAGETDLRRAGFHQAPLADLSAPPCAFLHPALRRWLFLVIPFLRLRLARAGIDADAKLFERPGRLFVTATHVDLVMPQNAVSLPVRRAGLDRNPGWLGDFGRIILFHYE